MKSILVHADDSGAMDARLEAGLALARQRNGHLTLLINTPFYRFVSMDPFGGTYLAKEAWEKAQASDTALAARLEQLLAHQDVPWNIEQGSGDLVASLAGSAALADLIIVSMTPAGSGQYDGVPMLAGDLALASGTPVLAVPPAGGMVNLNGPVVIAWNGGAEAAAALRYAVPLLDGRDVTVLRVGAAEGKFPETAALKYLARHGVKAELCEISDPALSTEEQIEATALGMGASLLVMGAFGHSRLRETLFGGVTRYLLDSAKVPLLLAH